MTTEPISGDRLKELCRGWTPLGLAHFYEGVFKESGFKLPPHMWPVVLGLCDMRIKKLMLICGPGSTKSQLLSVVYPAWLLGHDASMTVLEVSGGESLAQGFQSAVQEIIEYSPFWNEIFPNVRPDKNAGWSNDRGLFVTGRKPGIPDASYLAAGLQSRYIVGKHCKTMIIDDPHDDSNSQTLDQLEGVVRKFSNTLLGRADPMGCRFIMAGRRWHQKDLYQELMNSEDWVVMVLPAERPGAEILYHDIHVPDDVDCIFTDKKVHCADGTIVDLRDSLRAPH
jgi:hypothetical protein